MERIKGAVRLDTSAADRGITGRKSITGSYRGQHQTSSHHRPKAPTAAAPAGARARWRLRNGRVCCKRLECALCKLICCNKKLLIMVGLRAAHVPRERPAAASGTMTALGDRQGGRRYALRGRTHGLRAGARAHLNAGSHCGGVSCRCSVAGAAGHGSAGAPAFSAASAVIVRSHQATA